MIYLARQSANELQSANVNHQRPIPIHIPNTFYVNDRGFETEIAKVKRNLKIGRQVACLDSH